MLSGPELNARRTTPRFTLTKFESGRRPDQIESVDNDQEDDDSKSSAKSVEARGHGSTSMLPESLEEEDEEDDPNKRRLATENTGSDNDKDNDDVQLSTIGKRRHPLSINDLSRFVMPRLSGPSLVSQSLNMMSLSGVAQAQTPAARPNFKLPSEPSSPPYVPPAFSPRRRGEKFVPGGCASTVRAWIMEAAQTSHINKSITVEHCCTEENFVIVQGQGMMAIIAGLGNPIPKGSILIIKRGWTVHMQTIGTWIIGVEWKID